jgi:nicotinamide-nucleotide amidase
MRCEVIAIGTELLLGQITDTNSSWIGEQLALAGIDSFHQVKVGDNHARIVDALRTALARADAVICCGGLGPTQDDITREGIAEVMGARLVRDPDIAARIRGMFESRGRVMPENNLRQAEIPEGARAIADMPGTAPGLICPLGQRVVYAVPGVPSEMRAMMRGTILPDLIARAGFSGVIRSRVLRTWGQSESGLAEALAPLMDELDVTGRATLAFQASGMEGIKVRITVKAPDEAHALALLTKEDTAVRAVIGDAIFGVDEQSMESVVLACLQRRGLRLAVAESATAGLMAQRLAARREAAAFAGGLLLPDDASRERLLGLTPENPEADTVAAMARGVRSAFGADIGLATLPASTADALPGTVHAALCLDERVETRSFRLPGDPARVREYAVISALDFLRRQLST